MYVNWCVDIFDIGRIDLFYYCLAEHDGCSLGYTGSFNLLNHANMPKICASSFLFVFLAFGKLLEDIHVTWTHLGKKQDKIAALHEVAWKICAQCQETASEILVTSS
ncbi:hypothetical protein Tco_0065492 [Tanacetum coccineum]